MTTSLKHQILVFWQQAKSFPNYEPSPEIDQFFSELCSYARTDFDVSKDENGDQKIDFSALEVKELQKICSIAEEKMEKFWSQKIAESSDPRNTLSTFMYYQNYEQLTKLEYHLLLSQLPNLQKVLFVGSGALPLTAILLAKWGVSSMLIERDAEAFKISNQLIENLDLKGKIEIMQSDFLDFSSEEKFDAVLMASLLFTSEDADLLLTHLNQHITFEKCLIRTVEGMRQLLYQKIPLDLVKKHFQLELELHPKNEIINSILLCSHAQH